MAKYILKKFLFRHIYKKKTKKDHKNQGASKSIKDYGKEYPKDNGQAHIVCDKQKI